MAHWSPDNMGARAAAVRGLPWGVRSESDALARGSRSRGRPVVVVAGTGRQEGQGDLDVEPTPSPGAAYDARSMSDGNGVDDGQAQAEAVDRVVEALERLKKSIDFLGWDAKAGIAYRQHRAPGFDASRDIDLATGDVVTHRVVDEVSYQAVEKPGGP